MEFTVENEGCRLFCKKRGEGELLLLIHGVVCDSDYFDAAADILSKHYTVVTYDRRGYTRSACDDGAEYSVAVQSRDAAAVIEACGDSAYVVGCSAGGIIAAELTFRRPELVKKLFLHEPPTSNEPDFIERLNAWRDELRFCAANRKTAKAMVSFVRQIGGVDKRAPKRPIERQDSDLKTLPTFLYHEQEEMLGYIVDELKNIKLSVPCTVAVGELDGEGLFHLAGSGAAKILNARLMSVPGYHNFAADLPYEFALTVLGVMKVQEADIS